jgi:hypothetical protein
MSCTLSVLDSLSLLGTLTVTAVHFGVSWMTLIGKIWKRKREWYLRSYLCTQHIFTALYNDTSHSNCLIDGPVPAAQF